MRFLLSSGIYGTNGLKRKYDSMKTCCQKKKRRIKKNNSVEAGFGVGFGLLAFRFSVVSKCRGYAYLSRRIGFSAQFLL